MPLFTPELAGRGMERVRDAPQHRRERPRAHYAPERTQSATNPQGRKGGTLLGVDRFSARSSSAGIQR
jgi:hypothetical protein